MTNSLLNQLSIGIDLIAILATCIYIAYILTEIFSASNNFPSKQPKGDGIFGFNGILSMGRGFLECGPVKRSLAGQNVRVR